MVPSFAAWSSSPAPEPAHPKDHFHPRSASSSSQDPKDKPKKPRHRHSAFQLAALNELYDRDEHPPLEERTSLADRLGMEVKTVNAWFQNKRASCKKRNNKVASAPAATHRNNSSSNSNNNTNQFELPSISQLIASVSAPSPPDYDDSEDDHSFVDRLPPISASTQQRPPRSHSIFYSSSSQHQHLFETEMSMPRKGRSRPSAVQTEQLRKLYDANPHPSKEQREDLGRQIGMRYQSVTNWFQNQRSIAKKRKEEEDARASHLDRTSSSSSSRAPTSTPAPSLGAFPPSSSVLHPSLAHPSLAVPPATGHPSLPGLPFSHRIIRSPSAAPLADSRTSSPRPSPYSPALTERASSVSGRPRRCRPEPYQLEALKKLFHRTATPSIEERGALAIEINMDVGKVTNWFRNLRQTARKRTKQSTDQEDEDDDDDDMSMSGFNDFSRSASRAASPTPTHSSSSDRDMHMDMDQDSPDHAALQVKLEEDEQKQRSMYSHSLASNSRSSDMASEEDAQEAVTPSPASSPYPALPQVVQKPMQSPQPTRNISFTIGPLSDMEKAAADLTTTGVKFEDAMLLLSFHHNVVR